ncbi:MAG: thioredoxin family protein [Desulfuromonas sp.]|uniref:thioredoxin family protein n=1 Tax=Desulfuromonas sp. TaxID=892 RepID=UPI000CB0600F|nr:thioredoxin family protein [Desulfuromonas sp.]PLX85509.1 MAG: thioredoxin family protein [Desulfuromonas sp.]
MKIEVLGPGCKNCKTLFENARKAVSETGVAAEVVKVEEMQKILAYGILKTPGLAIDGQIKFSGRVASAEEIKTFLE